jgi:tetratricopeptide (TPR) repeat protein
VHESLIDDSLEDSWAFNLLGIVNQKEGMFDDAILAYKEAIDLNPEFAIAYGNRARLYRAIKDDDNALQDLTFAIKLNPDRADAHYERGQIFLEKDEFSKAQKDFDAALKRNRGMVEAYNGRGLVFKDKTTPDFTQAIRDLKFAIILNPEYAEAHNSLGAVYYKKKQFDLAIQHYNLAIKYESNNSVFLSNLALAYLEKGKWSCLEEGNKNMASQSFETVLKITKQGESSHERALQFLKSIKDGPCPPTSVNS